MKEFIVNLYQNENFPIYLGAIIFALVVAFFVVFFVGRKDKKKIEQTQKLNTIDTNTFKETSAPVNVEVTPVVTPEPTINETPVVDEPAPVLDDYTSPVVEEPSFVAMPEVQAEPTFEPAEVLDSSAIPEPIINETPVFETPTPAVPEAPVFEAEPAIQFPTVETPVEKVEEVPVFESPVAPINNDEPVFEPAPVSESIPTIDIPPVEPPVAENEPVIQFPENESYQVSKPVENDNIEVNLNNFSSIADSIAKELEELEKQESKVNAPVNEPVLPEVELSSIPTIPVESERKTTIVNDVYSSVYAPKKEEPEEDDSLEIELPKLKSEPILEESKEPNLNI